MKKLLLILPIIFLLAAQNVSARENFWKGLFGIHGRGGCLNASWHALKDDDHHLVYPDCIIGGETPEPSESPEPSGTPTGTASATPTETPTETPTATPTATPAESPTGSPVATETPTASPSETPTGSPISLTSAEERSGSRGLLQRLIELINSLIED